MEIHIQVKTKAFVGLQEFLHLEPLQLTVDLGQKMFVPNAKMKAQYGKILMYFRFYVLVRKSTPIIFDWIQTSFNHEQL